jgi:preprotein translocase subunit SecA
VALPIQQWLDEDDHLYEETLREKLMPELVAAYNEKEDQAGAEALRTFEKQIVLRVLDDLWKDHLSTMDHLRHGIHLRGYAQKNPKQEYKRESFTLFSNCWIRSSAIRSVCCRTFRFVAKIRPKKKPVCVKKPKHWRRACSSSMKKHLVWSSRKRWVRRSMWPWPPRRCEQKLGRNELCYCGSGKKFKHCHGRSVTPFQTLKYPRRDRLLPSRRFAITPPLFLKRCTSSLGAHSWLLVLVLCHVAPGCRF